MKRVLLMQWHGLTALWLWIRGRRHGMGPDDTAIGYARDQLPTLFVLTGALALETFVVGMLVPWWWIHVLDVVAVLQVLAIAAVMVTRPHVLRGDTLILREGSMYEVHVPLASIASARHHRKDHNGRHIELTGEILTISVGNQTDVTLVLSGPVSTPDGDATTIRFRADEPKAAVTAINAAINAASSKLATDVHEVVTHLVDGVDSHPPQ